jgi:adenosine/AMP kinase
VIQIGATRIMVGTSREVTVELHAVKIAKSDDVNVIVGQTHFIKSVEDLHESLVGAMPGIEFGLAFCEASGPALVRLSGTSDRLIEQARENALAIGAGHVFVILLGNAFPINVLNAIKSVPEVCTIFCASANPVEVIVAETGQGRGVLGVIDGMKPQGVESEAEIAERKALLRRFGYKLA